MSAEEKLILELKQEIAELKAIIVKLYAIKEAQEKELVYYRNKKNSGNNSIPPSQYLFRTKRTKSLREKSGKKSGGQKGHEGKPYFNTNCQSHQICTAHLLRDLKYLQEHYLEDDWTESFKALPLDALQLKKQMTRIDYYYPNQQRNAIEQRLEELLRRQINSKHEKLYTFHQRMIKYKDFLLQFLYRHDIPSVNNSSKRVMKTFKVKQKISGLFRSKEGTKYFAIIRSIIDTAIKNSQNVLNALAVIAKN